MGEPSWASLRPPRSNRHPHALFRQDTLTVPFEAKEHAVYVRDEAQIDVSARLSHRALPVPVFWRRLVAFPTKKGRSSSGDGRKATRAMHRIGLRPGNRNTAMDGKPRGQCAALASAQATESVQQPAKEWSLLA